jgi:phospholipid-binding lipoprotein MlaA
MRMEPLFMRLGVCLWMLLAGCATSQDRQSLETEQAGKEGAGMPFPGFRAAQKVEMDMAPHVVSYSHYSDPIEFVNRRLFSFNDVTYRFVLIPVANGYLWIMPDPVERGISNVFYTIKTPVYAVNHLLQLKPAEAGQNVLRFGINATVGLLGFFDPAKAWFGLERRETHLEDTLAGYGMGYGIYLVLPFFGPSDVRNGVSKLGGALLNPLTYLVPFPESLAVNGVDYLQDYAPQADRYPPLRRGSEDPYLFFRNLYLQGVQRDAAY